jgi:hypothetical protein
VPHTSAALEINVWRWLSSFMVRLVVEQRVEKLANSSRIALP